VTSCLLVCARGLRIPIIALASLSIPVAIWMAGWGAADTQGARRLVVSLDIPGSEHLMAIWMAMQVLNFFVIQHLESANDNFTALFLS